MLPQEKVQAVEVRNMKRFPIDSQGMASGRGRKDWNWAAIHLNDGSEIMATSNAHGAKEDQWLIVVDRDGDPTAYSDIIFEPVRSWHRSRSFLDYPTCWRLDAVKAGIALEIRAIFDDQEFFTLKSRRALRGGHCDVKGTIRGKRVSGIAYIERAVSSQSRTLTVLSRSSARRFENRSATTSFLFGPNHSRAGP